jgi:hypothetical protein
MSAERDAASSSAQARTTAARSVVLDHGEVVECGGDTLALDERESSSVVLRLALWQAQTS